MNADDQIKNARNNIRVLRESRGLTMKQATSACGLGEKNRFDPIERGVGTLHLWEIVKIADYFGVSVDDLLKRTAKITFE